MRIPPTITLTAEINKCRTHAGCNQIKDNPFQGQYVVIMIIYIPIINGINNLFNTQYYLENMKIKMNEYIHI